MSSFKIEVAGRAVSVDTVHILPYGVCRPFFSERVPDFHICSTQDDIDNERALFQREKGNAALWDGNIEVLAVLRILADRFIDYDTLVLHGAVIAVDGFAYLFSGKSGTGKTTHILKWLKRLPDAFVVNGDKPFIKMSGGNAPPLACGSPWAGKESMYTNAMVPLKSIILMERAEENRIEQISFIQAFPFLLQQVYRPEDEEKMRKTLKLMQQLNPAVSFWRFHCNNFKDDCFDVAYGALVKGQP